MPGPPRRANTISPHRGDSSRADCGGQAPRSTPVCSLFVGFLLCTSAAFEPARASLAPAKPPKGTRTSARWPTCGPRSSMLRVGGPAQHWVCRRKRLFYPMLLNVAQSCAMCPRATLGAPGHEGRPFRPLVSSIAAAPLFPHDTSTSTTTRPPEKTGPDFGIFTKKVGPGAPDEEFETYVARARPVTDRTTLPL